MDSNVPPENCLENEFIDRISDMHDSILGKILSYMPTKDAVATSILSTRWKNLFPFALTHIKLDLNDFKPFSHQEQTPSPSFMNFLDKLFNETLLSVPCVDRILIRCGGGYGEEKIASWLCSALRLKMVNLCLFCRLKNSETLFHSLNGCTTLVELELGWNFKVCVPEDFVLPNLKKVSLQSLIIDGDTDSFHKLLSCPMLEHLTLNACVWKPRGFLYIKSSVLKRLFIMRCHGFGVQIDAPKLESFQYKWNDMLKFVMEDSDSLRLAGNLNAALLQPFVRVPMFMNLTFLVFGPLNRRGFEIVARLLNNAPNLQTLTIDEGFENCGGGYASFESSLPSMPDCLKLCFKKIEIHLIKGGEEVIKLIEYFLKNGRMLEEVRIIYLPIVDMSVFDRLMMFPRHSKICDIFLKEKALS